MSTKPSSDLERKMKLPLVGDLFLLQQPIYLEVTDVLFEHSSKGSIRIVVETKPEIYCRLSETSKPSSVSLTPPVSNWERDALIQEAFCNLLRPIIAHLASVLSDKESASNFQNYRVDPAFGRYLASVNQAVESLASGSSVVNLAWESLRLQYKSLYHSLKA